MSIQPLLVRDLECNRSLLMLPTKCCQNLRIERRQRAEGRGQKDRLTGDSDSPLNVDHQNKVFGGGFKPKKVEGERTAEPSAFCLCSAASSAFQGGSLGNICKEVQPYKFLSTNRSLVFLHSKPYSIPKKVCT